MPNETDHDLPPSPKKRIYRDIAFKYYSHLQDNVFVVRQGDRFECLSSHRCGPPVEQAAQGTVANCPKSI